MLPLSSAAVNPRFLTRKKKNLVFNCRHHLQLDNHGGQQACRYLPGRHQGCSSSPSRRQDPEDKLNQSRSGSPISVFVDLVCRWQRAFVIWVGIWCWIGKLFGECPDLICNDTTKISTLKLHFHSTVHLKDLGPLKYFLSIEVTRTIEYALDILTESGMLGARPCSFPMKQQLRLSSDSSYPIIDPSQYHK